MKILMYNTVSDEMPYVEKWTEKTGHEVVTIDQPLNETTVDRAKGLMQLPHNKQQPLMHQFMRN